MERDVLVRPWRSATLVVGVLAVLGAGVTATPAFAGGLKCGDQIAEDTTLHADLLDCPGNGLEIVADGVTLDLNGHLIDGVGAGAGVISFGNDDVEIVNGAVREFGTGVSIVRSRELVTSQTSIPTNHLIRRLIVVDNAQDGIEVRNSFKTVVQRSRAARNGGYGVMIAGGASNVVEQSTVVANRRGGVLIEFGGRLPGGSNNNLVRLNAVVANGGSGISLGTNALAPFTFIGNRIEANDVIANEIDGISVVAGSGVVEDNRTDRNGDDGIDVDCFRRGPQAPPPCETSLTLTLTGNLARRNRDLGIEADPGPALIDGGGNRARRNGNPAQCVNVACG